MAKIDRIKEDVGWYKIIFGILIASGFSLLAWIADKSSSAPIWLVVVSIIGVMGIFIAAYKLHLYAMKEIAKLEDL
jgi:hypothetical protein